MNTVISLVSLVILLVVAVWIAVFGGIGALLAPRHGRSKMNGFLFGTMLGPVGWLVVLFVRPPTVTSRNGGLPPVIDTDVLDPIRVDRTNDSEVGYF